MFETTGKKKLISVTNKHIRKGIASCHAACPIALALNEQLNYNNCFVNYSHINAYKSSMRAPRSVMRFINRFDRGDNVKPFKFWWNPTKDI